MGSQPLPPVPDLKPFGGFARNAWRWVAAYGANPDPRVASCNTIALLVASNQPFYPLYVYFSVSRHVAPVLLTFLSTPFLPDHPRGLPAMAKTGPCAPANNRPRQRGRERKSVSARRPGVAMFIVPCALIAAAFFRPSERIFAFALLGLASGDFPGDRQPCLRWTDPRLLADANMPLSFD